MVNRLFSGRYYNINRHFMRQIGIWPEQARAARMILPYLTVGTIGSILVPEIVRLHDAMGKDSDTVIEGIPPMIIIVTSYTKVINAVIKRTAMWTLVKRMENDWIRFSNNPSSMAILRKYAEQGRFLTILYACFIAFVTTAFVGLPVIPLVLNVIVPLNESREKKYLYAAEYGVDPEQYYYYMLLHSYLTTYVCMGIHAIVDTTFGTWTQHCCALFEIVSYNLKYTLGQENPELPAETSVNNIEYRNICFCVKQHQEAISFADLIESTYSMSFAIITAMNMVVMSISGVLVLIHSNDLEDVLRFSVLTLAPLFHLYFNTVPGQKLIDHSERIKESAYENDWCSFDTRAQRLLILIIARAQKPNILTAGKYYVMNMESFSSVLQTSVSYFTVLSSVR